MSFVHPIAFHLFGWPVHWYGIMYVLAFWTAFYLAQCRRQQSHWQQVSDHDIEEYLLYSMWGVIVGGRLGEVLLYHPLFYFAHPGEILCVWHGGMSYHGGYIGVMCAMFLLSYRKNRPFFDITDFIAPLVQIGYAYGRIGNFLNGELPGQPTDQPWGVIFPTVDAIPRHPSPIYQAAIDGVLFFWILWVYARRPRVRGYVSAWYCIGYGITRSVTECFRVPDFVVTVGGFYLTSGQLYSLPMVGVGLVILVLTTRWANQPVAKSSDY